MKKLVLLVFPAVLLMSCRPLWLNTVDVDPAAPPQYRLGWEDGCDSGLSSEGGWTYKMTYGYKKRPEMAANEQYKQAWNEGFSYCRFSLAASNQSHDFSDVGLGGGFQ
jgi:hypothetical protein